MSEQDSNIVEKSLNEKCKDFLPRSRWDNNTKNLLESLFKDVLNGVVKEFIIVVEAPDGVKLSYKSRNGKYLASWALEQEET